MSFSVSSVAPVDLEIVWPQVLPMVERGCRRGAGDTTTPEAIRAAVESGDMTMWAIHEGETVHAVTTFHIVQRPRKRVLFVTMLAGRDMDLWIEELISLLHDFKDIVGADDMEATCRPGLAEYLRKLGWRKKAVIMESQHG